MLPASVSCHIGRFYRHPVSRGWMCDSTFYKAQDLMKSDREVPIVLTAQVLVSESPPPAPNTPPRLFFRMELPDPMGGSFLFVSFLVSLCFLAQC